MALKWLYTNGIISLADRQTSLGGALSLLELTTGLQNLFDNVTATEASSGDTEYRCVDLYADAGDFYEILLYNSVPSSGYVGLTWAFELKLEEDETHLPIQKQAAVANEGTAPNEIYDAVWMFHNGNSGLEVGMTVENNNAEDSWGTVLAITPTRIVIRATDPGDGITTFNFQDGDSIHKDDNSGAHCVVIMNQQIYSRAFNTFTALVPLELPSLHAGERHRLWIKRIVTNGALSTPSDTATITVEYIAGTIATSTSSSTTA